MMHNFSANLKHWAIHGSVNALPNFILALWGGWVGFEAIAAMILGTALFIVAISLVTSTRFHNDKIQGTSLHWAFNWVKKIRFWKSLITAPFLMSYIAFLVGFIEILAANLSCTLLESISVFGGEDYFGSYAFFPTLLMTLTQGVVILSWMIFLSFGISSSVWAYKKIRGLCRR